MDAQFNQIFRVLDEDYIILDRFRDTVLVRPLRFNVAVNGVTQNVNIALLIKSAVERVIGKMEFHDRIRSDARHFLLVNFTEMVAYPLALNAKSEFSIEEIIADIESDTEQILIQASQQPNVQSDNQISGGDILQAVAQEYSNLKVARFRVWN